MAQALPQFPPFNVHEDGAVAQRWKKWVGRLENLFKGMGLDDDTEQERERALLLHYAGESVYDIFETLPGTGTDYKTAKEKLDEYFMPKRNVEYEKFIFRQAEQNPGETIDEFHTRLRQLAAHCEFTDIDLEIKSQIIQKCKSSKLRKTGLKEKITLVQLLAAGRANEQTDKQAAQIEKKETANAIKTGTPFKKGHSVKHGSRQSGHWRCNDKQSQWKKQEKPKSECRFCGGTFPHEKSCPAKGRSCNYCGKPNHFFKMCKSRLRKQNIRQLEDSGGKPENTDSSDDDYVFGVRKELYSIKNQDKNPSTSVTLENTKLNLIVDTGASVNVMSRKTYDRLQRQPKLQKTVTKIYAYGSKTPLPIEGKFDTTIESKSNFCIAEFYVIDANSESLISYETAVQLKIIPVIRNIADGTSDEICREYSTLFKGIGKLKDKSVKIHIDETVQPVVQQHRRIPFHLRKKVEAELQRLEDLDIIEKVEGPTPWVSPIVVAPKPKNPEQIRICIDMRLPNQAVKRERHITPTIDDIILELNGSKVFSKLDLNSGYHQLELDEESRFITTFTTHVGLRRYKRLIFGISSAAEVFQNTIRETLNGLSGVQNMSDDIIVYGKSQTEHDTNLRAVFQRLHEKNITLNKAKCQFNKTSLEFYGYVISDRGVSADPKKVESIKQAAAPTNVSEVRSLLGMTNYVSRFIQNYSTITEPLRKLTRNNTDWTWGPAQQEALDTLKDKITSDTVMTFFDPNKQSELVVDASPVGLGAVLSQQGRIIAYASRSLTDVESRYSQTEREALGIIWGCERFHLYLFGNKFTLVTDHQPLEAILNNPRSRPPARIERWRMRLQQYDFVAEYKSGKSNPADYMSRHPLINEQKHTELENTAENYVNFLVSHGVPKAMKLEEITEETRKDETLQLIIDNIKSGLWEYGENKEMQSFARVKHELTIVPVENGSIILRDNRIVIPTSLRRQVIDIAHEGHQGIVKTKGLIREKVWFPDIDELVNETCKQCVPCLAATPGSRVEPLKMSDLPKSPWSEVCLDFCGPFPTGEYLLVIVDEYSRYPVVEIIHNITARTVIPHLDKIFSSFGIPDVVKTDNGAPFQGHDFKNFAAYLGFKHRKITPLWPKANAEAERFMKTISKAIRAANADGKNWRQEMYKFLRNYRATPHSSTKIASAVALFNRNFKVRLPEHPSMGKIVNNSKTSKIRQNDMEAKTKMKSYSDNRTRAKPTDIEIGDRVLIKQKKENKLSTPFKPLPYEVSNKKGSMITAKRGDSMVTRNSSHFKTISGSEVDDIHEQEEIIIDSDRGTTNSESDHSGVTNTRPTRDRKPPKYLEDYVRK